MAQQIHTRTIHTLVIDIQDDVLSTVDQGDEVEVVLQGRGGPITAKRLTYRDLETLMSTADWPTYPTKRLKRSS